MTAKRGRQNHAKIMYQVMTPPGTIQLYPSLAGHYKTDLRANRLTGLNALVC
jgi:hypothetical protein